MFIRTKRIKGHLYGYLVENRWLKRKKKPKQKVKCYLGRVYELPEVRMADFYEFVGGAIEKLGGIDIVKKLVSYELWKRGFELDSGVWKKDGIEIDIENCMFRNVLGKKVAIAINEGILADETLRRVYRCEADPYKLAKALVECGLKVPKEIFVVLFERWKR